MKITKAWNKGNQTFGEVTAENGEGNKGKPKSEEHKRKIAESIRAKYNKD